MRLRKLPIFLLCCAVSFLSFSQERPNLIFILADDLGYGDLGCYGQEKIATPRLDQMAEEGMKFTQFYAGSTVCAPSRCVLMTGQDTGHCRVRGNGGAEAQTLKPEDVTVAELLKGQGYNTALIGKWGLGELGSTGHPNEQGFDYFFGYLNQRHAHNYYPPFLVRDSTIVPLTNRPDPRWDSMRVERGWEKNGAGFAEPEGRLAYSHDLFVEESLKWVKEQSDSDDPFFLYLPLTIPHANNEGTRGTGNGQEVPDYGIYETKDWPEPNKGQAAMITRMDRDIGRLVDLLADLDLDEKTLVFFTSDNGHHKEGGNDPEFFDANGPLRGMKRDLTEGGIRVPAIAYWPGTIEAGSVSDHIAGFTDWMATTCDLSGAALPERTQSISFLPTLLGKTGEQEEHEFLYWEFYERGSKQAVRFGDWKGIRKPMFDGKLELYNLADDLGEENNLAGAHPDEAAQAVRYLEKGHVPNPLWKIKK